MRKNFTDLTVVLDRTGSMAGIAKDMEGGFDTFIAEQKALPGALNVSLLQFDSEATEWVYTAKPVADVPPLRLIPRGSTPLWDAVGRAVTQTGERLAAMPEAERPERVLFMVITDGQENASREWTAEKVKALVKTQTDVYKWGFLFLGANIDSFAVGGQMGVGAAGSANYAPSAAGVRGMMAGAGQRVNSYRTAKTQEDAARGLSFTDDERAAMSDKK